GRTAIARAMARFYEDGGELEDADTNFKVVDSHGRTVVRNMKDAAAPAPAPAPTPAPLPPAASRETPSVRGGSPVELLRGVEDVQRKEVAALKAMVELLIEKGVFTREEYLAKVKR
ncbi:MAG: hypothetical protein ABW123_23660, partial [Cystobacter sp.]